MYKMLWQRLQWVLLLVLKLNDSAKALMTAKLTGSRQEIVHIGTMTVINDAYNASPASMEAAVKNFT